MEAFGPLEWAIWVAALAAGGVVKGVLGIGLPLVAVPLMSIVMPPPTAIAIMILPILISNIFQMRPDRALLPIARRFAVLLVTLLAGILLGVYLLTNLEVSFIYLAMSGLLLLFLSARALSYRPKVSPALEPKLTPLVGFFSGIVGGVSSFFGPPVVIYLTGLGLGREEFLRAMALVYVVGLTPLYAALAVVDILSGQELLLSAVAVLPVFAGMALGQWLGSRIPVVLFERGLLLLLLFVAIDLARRGLA